MNRSESLVIDVCERSTLSMRVSVAVSPTSPGTGTWPGIVWNSSNSHERRSSSTSSSSLSELKSGARYRIKPFLGVSGPSAPLIVRQTRYIVRAARLLPGRAAACYLYSRVDKSLSYLLNWVGHCPLSIYY